MGVMVSTVYTLYTAAAAHTRTLPHSLAAAQSLPLCYCIITALLFYTCVWHGVLSNLPLDAPMPYAVHSRFWMQPDLLVAALTGVYRTYVYVYLCVYEC